MSEQGCGAGSRSAFIVLPTSGNWARQDPTEGREAPQVESHWRETRERTLDLMNLSTKRQWIAELARSKRGEALFSLHHVIDLEWMVEAWRLTRKDGASGIDGMTAADYEANLQANLLDLLERLKSGRYQAPPVRRTYIPKADGTPRPLGIPTVEDKVAQRAIVMVLEAVYEQDFLSCSYGFRPGRSAHQALQSLRNACMDERLRWVLDVDIRKYFDTISHQHLRAFLDQRVTDGVIRRMIDKSILVRYADDFVMAFADVHDAERVRAVLGKRFERYGLMLHADKTRFVDFRPVREGGDNHPGTSGTTFDFLGFTHVWGKSRRGHDVVRQVTAKSRFARGLAAVSDWCRHNLHQPVREQQRHLSAMARGHYAYYGMSGNMRRLRWYGHQLVRTWKRWLSRRGDALCWQSLNVLLEHHPLPKARIIHRYAILSEPPR